MYRRYTLPRTDTVKASSEASSTLFTVTWEKMWQKCITKGQPESLHCESVQWACRYTHGCTHGGEGDTLTAILCLLRTLKTYRLCVSDKVAGWRLWCTGDSSGNHRTARLVYYRGGICVSLCVCVENRSFFCITSVSYWTIGCFTEPTLLPPLVWVERQKQDVCERVSVCVCVLW